MSWKIVSHLRKLLAEESGRVPTKRGGRLRICLLYPNTYRTAMSNLGFQTVYARLNAEPDILCERAFLPDPAELQEYRSSRTPLLSLESQLPVSGFDLLAFSISFESDYLHLPLMLELAGLPLFTADRQDGMPLIIGGGAALFLNPEPVADFFDAICIGEAEPLLPQLLEALEDIQGAPRAEAWPRLARCPGVYVPSLYEVEYRDNSLAAIVPRSAAPARVARLWAEDLDECPTGSEIISPHTEFGDMHLLELSRGCPRGCRFCAAGFIYLPFRQRSVELMKQEADRALEHHRKLGLVAAAVGDYHGIGELCRHILASGGAVSVSSLRIDGLDDDMIDVLVASGHKTATLAPEGGSQRLRDLIRKGISEEQIFAACDRLIGRDILNLKLYFIIGLPTETDEDMEEMVSLVARLRERVVDRARANRRLGEIVLSINPFIPKPFTPFQWCGMCSSKVLEQRVKFLQRNLGKLPNVRVQVESLKDAQVQALLSRGDRRLAGLIVAVHRTGSLRRAAKELGLDVEGMVTRCYQLTELFPWDIIDNPGRERLLSEYRTAFPD